MWHMEITYLGHACFRLKGKNAVVVTDPYDKSVGFLMPKMSADIITISHDHEDHNAFSRISGTTRRPQPYVIRAPGEYEVSGVGVFGWGTFHDGEQGTLRGKNTIYTIHMDNLTLAHLGDLGEPLSDQYVDYLGRVDILFTPVGGYYSLSARDAEKVIARLKPSIVIPMHYKTPEHNQETFGMMDGVQTFLKEMEVEMPVPKHTLKITDLDLPEETEVVVLTKDDPASSAP